MKQYIDKSDIVAELNRLIDNGKYSEEYDYAFRDGNNAVCNQILHFLDTLEVKEIDLDMPGLDNGNMPIERWKEACKAASCQANYRKSQGYTKTYDDYFVDGVQWADEHPIKTKDVDLEKEFDKYCENYIFDDECDVYTARHFFELGFKVQKGE